MGTHLVMSDKDRRRKEIVTRRPEFPQADLSGSAAEDDPNITKSGIMPA